MIKKFMLVSLIALSGCSTIHFANGPQVEDTVVREQWHHNTLNDLVEISPPMNLTYNCANQEWDTVTIERSFLNGFVGFFTQAVDGLSFYSPWTIRYHCRDPLESMSEIEPPLKPQSSN